MEGPPPSPPNPARWVSGACNSGSPLDGNVGTWFRLGRNCGHIAAFRLLCSVQKLWVWIYEALAFSRRKCAARGACDLLTSARAAAVCRSASSARDVSADGWDLELRVRSLVVSCPRSRDRRPWFAVVAAACTVGLMSATRRAVFFFFQIFTEAV